MKINEKKLKRQNEFIDKWIASNGRGSFEGCTGFGKSYIGILICKLTNQRHIGATIDIVVPSVYLKKKWEADLLINDIRNAKVYVVNTYVKERRNPKLLIIDEVHRVAAATFKKIFNVSHYSWGLGLTATMERHDGNHSIIEHHLPILDRVSLLEAEEAGFVAKHEIYNLGIHLSPHEQEEYDKVETTFNANFSKFQFDFGIANACLMGNATSYRLNSSRSFPELVGQSMTGSAWRLWYSDFMGFDGDPEHPFSPKNLQKAAAQFNWAMNERKKLIYSSPVKIDTAISIVKKYANKKFITFAQEIESVNDLNRQLIEEKIMSKTYHSKMSKKDKEFTLKGFNKNSFRILNTAKALDEGYDVEDIDITLQLSYTSTKLQNVQRIGRGIRFKEGKVGLAINLYLVGTQEEKWLESKQSGGGVKKPTYITSIDELPEL